jgi:hypothetical protein
VPIINSGSAIRKSSSQQIFSDGKPGDCWYKLPYGREEFGMTQDQDMSVQQRLRAELRNKRKLAHFTQKEVARAMDWSPSKMLRIETGAIGISTTDLRALLAYYDCKDERQTEELVELARTARARRGSQ